MSKPKALLFKAIKKLDNSSVLSGMLQNKNRKVIGLFVFMIMLPLVIVAAFFYSDIRLNNISSSISSSEEVQQPVSAEDPFGELRLISREEFLKKFNTSPAYLPKPVEITASLSGFLRSNSSNALLPARNWGVPFEDINSTSALAIEMPSGRILYGKNVYEIRPIASLSKITAALVTLDTSSLDEKATVSLNAIRSEGNAGNLVAGEVFTVKHLLYAMLLESSNDAAVALEEHYNNKKSSSDPDFVSLMNKKAVELGLNGTVFEEPTGLSPNNRSSAVDVAKTLYTAFENETLREIMGTPTYTVKSLNREINHYWINLNALLGTEPEVLGGKTGYTEEAGPSMATMASTPQEGKYLAIVVLNADDRLEASRQLLKWVERAYIWTE